MSQAYLYVMEILGNPGLSKIGTTSEPELNRRPLRVGNYIRNIARNSLRDMWPPNATVRYFWIARIPSTKIAVEVEKATKKRAGRRYDWMNDWQELPPEQLAICAAQVLAAAF